MLDFIRPGKASFILGGQFGSEAKGSAAAHLVSKCHEYGQPMFDIVTSNQSAQSGHTSIHDGKKRVLFHLPTAPVVANDIGLFPPLVYLNAGCAIDPDVLRKELEDTNYPLERFHIHPNAAVITDECRDAEMASDSAQTKIASTRKGVGQALARKVLRSGQIARDHKYLGQFVRRIDLNERLARGASVLVEVPQGFSLSLNGPFYPHCTSRDCTVGQAMSDAGIHPSFYGASMLVMRTYPIRVGGIPAPQDTVVPDKLLLGDDHGNFNMIGYSGGAYPGQRELSWEELGQTPEITTVTKRQRRVFEFSDEQLRQALLSARPTHIFLSFMDYFKGDDELWKRHNQRVMRIVKDCKLDDVHLLFASGPTTADVV